MATGNRLLIVMLGVVILAGCAAGFALEWTGRAGAAVFTGLATTALGILCPSPLRSWAGAAEPPSGPTAPDPPAGTEASHEG
jgi:hypothetical protein